MLGLHTQGTTTNHAETRGGVGAHDACLPAAVSRQDLAGDEDPEGFL